jgi:hypothetical protein
MPSSFIIKTKRPMSKYSLKRMAAKIIRESYGQRMNSCIVEELDVDSARAGIGLRTRFKYEFLNVEELIADVGSEADIIMQYAEKVGATRVYNALEDYMTGLWNAYNKAYDIVEDNFGEGFLYVNYASSGLQESYSQPKYRRLVEELETDGPHFKGPSRWAKGKMKDYISHSYGGHQRLSARINRLNGEKNNKLLYAIQHLKKVADKLGNKNISKAIFALKCAKADWREVLQTCGDPNLTNGRYSTPEQRYMKDRWNRYKLYDDDI